MNEYDLQIRVLRAAVEFRRPRLFANYAAWLGRVMVARGSSTAEVRRFLNGTHAIIARRSDPLHRESLDEYFQAAERALASAGAASREASSCEDDPFLAALLRADRPAAIRIALERYDALGLEPLYAGTFEPALTRVGELWETNRITVADEHAATKTAEYALAAVFARLEETGGTPPDARPKVLVTAVAGERHEIGPRMLADALTVAGWNVRFLGGDVPNMAVVEAVLDFKPRIVALSATLTANLPVVKLLVRAIKSLEYPPRVVVGGRAFLEDERLWADTGADGMIPDIRAAVAEFACWLEVPQENAAV